MSDFFKPPPSRPVQPAPPRYRPQPWNGPPHGTLPGVVALELVLVRTADVAVCVSRLSAYPTGAEFELVTMSADGDGQIDPLLFQPPHRASHGADGGLPPELLRFGVEFSDGRRATNIDEFDTDPARSGGPVLRAGGGSGGGGDWRQTQWVWPLPPPGMLSLVCEWPALGIPLTRTDLDAQVILEAATRAQVIFSDGDLPERPPDGGGGGWLAYGP